MIRKMCKALCLSAALAMTISLFAGCGDKDNKQATGTQDQAPKEKVNIQYFTWTTGSRDAIDPLVEKFNKTNEENIEVEVLWRTGDYQTGLKTSILAGQAPDLMHGTPNILESISNKWIEPWDDYLSDETKNRVKGLEYKINVDGKPQTYAFFWSTRTYRLAYNKDIFKKVGISAPPKDWNEFEDYAKEITEKGAGKYFGTALPCKGNGLEFWLTPALSLEGIYTNIYNFKTNKVDIMPIAPYVKLLRDMFNDKIVFPGSETMDNDAVRAQFAAGKIGMLLTVSWDVGAINTQFKATCDWGVAPFLAPMGPQKGLLIQRERANFQLSASSKNKKAVAKFLEFVFSDDYLSELYSKGTDMVTITSALNAAKSKPSPSKQWADYAPTEKEVQMSSFNMASQIAGDSWCAVVVKLILDPKQDIDKELQDYNERAMEGILKQAQSDAEKAKQAGTSIDKIGKIPVIDDYDPMKPIDQSKVRYVTAEEWHKLQK